MVQFIQKKIKLTVIFLICASFILFVVNLTLGPGEVTFSQAFEVIFQYFYTPKIDQTIHSLVFEIRLPRALLALLIGAALGCAGTITQGIFRNPLASPNVLGISSGAAVFVILGITLGITDHFLWVTPLLAALGSVFTFGLLYLLNLGGHRSIIALLLSGIALSTLFSALVALLLGISIQNYEVTAKVMQWLLGNFESKSWMHLTWGVIPISISLTCALFLRKNLDVLLLGEEAAKSLGVNISYTYVISILVVALLVGSATALSGVIGFVGLIIPHIGRLLIGAQHRKLIPFSIVLGAFFMLTVDILSRITLSIYLPPGVITSLVGAPLFIWLIRKYYKDIQQ